MLNTYPRFVGGQPTIADQIHFPNIFKNLGYKHTFSVESEGDLKTLLDKLPSDGPILIEIKINSGAREDLGRPTTNPLDNKIKFMDNLKMIFKNISIQTLTVFLMSLLQVISIMFLARLLSPLIFGQLAAASVIVPLQHVF